MVLMNLIQNINVINNPIVPAQARARITSMKLRHASRQILQFCIFLYTDTKHPAVKFR